MNIKEILVQDTLRSSFMRYSMTVICSRALPDARDGFKPVHRRVIYGMHDMGVYPGKPYTKSAKIVGSVMGSLHPHGDSSIYDTLVRMSQPFSLRYPLVDGQGNFGNIDGSPPAAMRYTESRMYKTAAFMLKDINKNVIDFKPNYDDSTTEPEVLPSALPNMLVNGGLGIAIGMATNMAPHNISEVSAAIRHFVENEKLGKDTDVEELLPYLSGPDFPTGGVVCGTSGFLQAMRTGRGKLVIRAKYHMEKTKSGRDRMVVTELPYLVNMVSLIAKIKEVHNEKKVEGISDIRDESAKDVRIVIDIKSDAVTEVVINQLFHHTELQTTFNYNNMALYRGRPTLMNLVDLVGAYVDHRHEVVQRRVQFDHDKADARIHILEGFTKAQANIDEVVKIIRAAADQSSAKVTLQEKFGFSDAQVDAVVAMRLGQLTALDANKISNELAELIETRAELQKILADKNLRLDLLLSELEEVVSEVEDGRRTVIEGEIDAIEDEDMIPDEEMVVTVSHEGYIKRVPLDAYRTQARGGVGSNTVNLKDDDFVTGIYQASSKKYLMFFTNFGRAHWLKVWNIPEGTRTGKGKALVNLLQGLQPGEKIQAVVVVPSFDEGHYFMFATANGKINKMASSLFSRPRRDGINAINLVDGDSLVSVLYATDEENLVLATDAGMAITFPASAFRSLGRGSAGVRGINMGINDKVVSMVHIKEGSRMLTITKNGYGKRTDPDEYRVTNRGGKGVKNISVTAKTGSVVYVSSVMPEDEVVVLTKSGIIIRTRVKAISEQGRAAQGVKVIDLRDGDEVIDAACVKGEENE